MTDLKKYRTLARVVKKRDEGVRVLFPAWDTFVTPFVAKEAIPPSIWDEMKEGYRCLVHACLGAECVEQLDPSNWGQERVHNVEDSVTDLVDLGKRLTVDEWVWRDGMLGAHRDKPEEKLRYGQGGVNDAQSSYTQAYQDWFTSVYHVDLTDRPTCGVLWGMVSDVFNTRAEPEDRDTATLRLHHNEGVTWQEFDGSEWVEHYFLGESDGEALAKAILWIRANPL